MYLIFSSYFKKTTCERKAKIVFNRLPARIADSEVKVSFILCEGYYPEIRFIGNDFIFRLKILTDV